MNPRQYERVMQLVDVLMDCEPEELEARISEECSGDDSLRREVEKLLAQDKPESSFLEESPLEVLSSLPPDEEPDQLIGKHIGAYRITEEIGRGGMGAVYKGVRDDEQYHTEVAIKLIKRGMDTDFILRRFRNERQILANLNHPNIAHMLEGGATADGLPYFVMEYIEGEPINKYCDKRKLSTIERLKLFRTVCAAVSYAHGNLIIHRDLKPSNILVTADGTPKLLDFGIAKLLRAETDATVTAVTAIELRTMTPEYASPEQVKGESITTASDVYSLGVLLYELLTGHRPYRFKSRRADEVARVISEVEPARPSTAISRVEEIKGPDDTGRSSITPESVSQVREGEREKLRRRLQGDIDNIVLKALRKAPERRYSSVEQLSEDIRRHLEGLPVTARKDTLSYRTQKFVQRHKVGVLAASLIVVALIGGMAATLWQARVARRESVIAERRFNDVRSIARNVIFDYHDAIAALPGSTKVRERLVTDSVAYLDRLAQEASDDTSLQREIATAYARIGDVQGGTLTNASGATLAAANLGNYQGASDNYRKALAIRERLVALEPWNRELREELGTSYARMGNINATLSKTDEAAAHYRRAIELYEQALASEPSNQIVRRKLSSLYFVMGRTQSALGDAPGGIESLRRSLSMDERLVAEDPTNPDNRHGLSTSHSVIGLLLSEDGNHAEALNHYRKALEIEEALVREHESNPLYRYEAATQHMNLGNALLALGDKGGAVEHLRQAQAMYESLVAADPDDAKTRRQTANNRRDLGVALAASGNQAGALESLRAALRLFDEAVAREPTNANLNRQRSLAYLRMSEFLSETGDLAEALENARLGVRIGEELVAANRSNTGFRKTLALNYSQLGRCHALQAARAGTPRAGQISQWREARGAYQRSLDIWNEFRAAGTLSRADAGKPDETAREIARCDASLNPS